MAYEVVRLVVPAYAARLAEILRNEGFTTARTSGYAGVELKEPPGTPQAKARLHSLTASFLAGIRVAQDRMGA